LGLSEPFLAVGVLRIQFNSFFKEFNSFFEVLELIERSGLEEDRLDFLPIPLNRLLSVLDRLPVVLLFQLYNGDICVASLVEGLKKLHSSLVGI
jgi:hypothetical protein